MLREAQFWDHVAASAIEAVDEGKGGQTQKEKTPPSPFASATTSDAADATVGGWGSIGDEHPTQVDGDGSDEDGSGSDDERVGRMSKYKFSRKTQGQISDWRVAGREKLPGHREKREAEKAAREKFKSQLKEAVALHEKVRADSAASVKAMEEGQPHEEEGWPREFRGSLQGV